MAGNGPLPGGLRTTASAVRLSLVARWMTSKGETFSGTTGGFDAGWPRAGLPATTNTSAIANANRPAMFVKLLDIGFSVAVRASHFLGSIHFGHSGSFSRSRKIWAYVSL